MLVHISGPSGSGKSTLANQLKKHNTLIVIDLDDVDDKHAMELISQPKYKRLLGTQKADQVYQKKRELNKAWLKDTVQPLLELGKTVVLVGLPFGYIKADKKFVIKIDSATLYRRVYTRTLDDIVNNSSKLRSLLNSEEHPEVIKFLCVHKYKLRQDFIGPPSFQEPAKFYEDHKKHGYKAMPVDKIKGLLLA